MTWRVVVGDVSDLLPTLEAESFDAVLCDPPYGLSFMGKHWDHGVPDAGVWREVARTLKPGAHLMAFGGTRTFHRLTCAIEDAGFEIRDCLSWLYGQGFPKSLDISKAIDKAAGVERPRVPGGVGSANTESLGRFRPGEAISGEAISGEAIIWQGYGTALKPAWEPCILAMKPTAGTFAENALAFGVAGLNVDGGRIGTTVETWPVSRRSGAGDSRTCARGSGEALTTATGPVPPGRWPANVLLDEEAAAALDEQSGERKAGESISGNEPSIPEMYDGGLKRVPFSSYRDTGGASRFFYCAKASRSEREAGLREAGLREAGRCDVTGRTEGNAGTEHPRAGITARGAIRNTHPTVKPLALCEYLARLILPPKRDTPRRLLVPFSGSGSEMIGALRAGWDEVVGIEREAEYVAIAEARLRHWIDQSAPLFSETRLAG